MLEMIYRDLMFAGPVLGSDHYRKPEKFLAYFVGEKKDKGDLSALLINTRMQKKGALNSIERAIYFS
jgi:hypothetical protein